MSVLDGKVAVVAGGTSGIGARAAELFAAEGARVIIAGRRREEGEELAAKLGSNVSFVQTDVLHEAQVEAMIGHAVGHFGRLDCMFNNAGGGRLPTGIADLDINNFDADIALNLRAVALGMKYAARVMQAQGSGSIINTGSVTGLRTGYASHSYSTAKAAVIHLTRCVAVELAAYNVRVNSISPGAIVTGIFDKRSNEKTKLQAEQTLDRLRDYFATVQPVPRAGMPDDIARAAVFLASDASSFVTGHDMVIDGGMAAGRDWSQMQAFRAEIGRCIAG
jgi:NAD(P)-dependent dehydrogenase (short-subunit alcohol dehydrogenase family)